MSEKKMDIHEWYASIHQVVGKDAKGTELFKCLCPGCTKKTPCKGARGFGRHYVYCGTTSEEEQEKRRKMLKQAGDKRYRQSEKGKAAAKRGAQSEAAKAASKRYEESEKGKATRKSYWQSKAGRAVQTRYQQTPKGKAARNAAVKRHLQTLKGKATIKRYQQTPKGKAAQKRYKNSVKGKLTRKLWFGRWKKNNPEKVEAKMRLLKSLWCKKNRIHPAKRENWKFARDFADAKKYKTFRDYDLSSPEEFLKKHGKEIKAVLKKIDETYSVADARLKNYVYLLSDGSMWNYEMTFEQWLATLFYIGRGVCWRVLQHFAEAKYYLDEGKDAFDSETQERIARIHEIWEKGSPVKVHLIDFGQFAEKCDFGEFSGTKFVGLGQLTNKKFDGVTSTPSGFTDEDVSLAGLHYLYEAFKNLGKVEDCTLEMDYGSMMKY